jgi:hypothetical protein
MIYHRAAPGSQLAPGAHNDNDSTCTNNIIIGRTIIIFLRMMLHFR